MLATGRRARASRRRAPLVLCLAVVLLVTATVWGRSRPAAERPLGRALVVSDSSLLVGGRPAGDVAAAMVGWQAVSRVIPGTAWTQGTTPATADRHQAAVLRGMADLASYDLIVLQAGAGDLAAPPAVIRVGVIHAVDVATARGRSGVTVVVIGPLLERGRYRDRDADVVARTVRAAAAGRALYVDAAERNLVVGGRDLPGVLADVMTSVTKSDGQP